MWSGDKVTSRLSIDGNASGNMHCRSLEAAIPKQHSSTFLAVLFGHGDDVLGRSGKGHGGSQELKY